MPVAIVPKVHEYILHPWGQGALAINGIQYGLISNAVTANTYVTLANAKPFNVVSGVTPYSRGKIKEVEFGLTAGFQANASAIFNYKWSARNLDPVTSTWVDIKPDELLVTATTWADATVTGYALPQADFNSVPFEVRCQFRCNSADLGIGRIKNSSYIRVIYEML